MSFEISKLTTEDFPALLTLIHDFLLEQGNLDATFLPSKNWEAHARDFLDKVQKSENYQILVLRDTHNQLRGFAIFGLDEEPLLEISKSGYIADLYVSPPLRGKGFGKLLASETIAIMKRLGASYIRIQALVQNQASLALWRNLGFRDYMHRMKLDFFE